MTEQINMVHRQHQGPLSSTELFSVHEAERARAFHRTIPVYAPTPLTNLPKLSEALGIASLHVKDESKRFGLNAFKGLGGSYCIGSYIANHLEMDISDLSYEKIRGNEVKEKLGTLTFVTATDGNHGRGIAWTAQQFGQHAVVYMPEGSAPERLHNIQALGADAEITDFNYDDTVRFASSQAEKNGWILTQDTAWEGYTQIPTWIMQGYLTMALEAVEQLGGEKPTHIFLQAGVGSMAGALTAFFRSLWGGGEGSPVITIVEPDQADCIYRTAKADDGKLHAVTGAMHSIMAGLCCGEPCSIAWEMLRDHADFFVSMPDCIAAKGMRVLGNPLGSDPRVISGESGASTTGLVAALCQDPDLATMREEIGLNQSARVLCFSTEGDTDKANYRRIVWDGLYPSFSEHTEG